jgi:hypothetical protein
LGFYLKGSGGWARGPEGWRIGPKEEVNMDERSTYTSCELEFIEEGYDPSAAAEICANEEGRRSSEKEPEKSKKDEHWDWWDE